MNKPTKVIVSILAFILIITISLYSIDCYYSNKIKNVYYDSIGNKLLFEKNQGVQLQKKALERTDNISIYGSSELSTTDVPSHPVNFFVNKSTGFQVNLIGTGHCQSIIHAINFGALSSELKNKKVVFIISPQWFMPSNLEPEQFNMNFSELQFYYFMFNKSLDDNLKIMLANRVKDYVNQNSKHIDIKQFVDLYTSKDMISKVIFSIITPYYKLKFYMLDIKDKVKTNKILATNKESNSNNQARKLNINWDDELNKETRVAVEETNNNNFFIQNDYYNKYIKDNLNKYKGAYTGQSYLNSPEYEDLKLLLAICRSNNIKPLFVSVPVNGIWYDYCDFPKEEREAYYNKLNNLVSSYGFSILDLSSHEYEPYFLKDIMHLGWKGWIYIDKSINEYYYSNKQ